MKDYYQILGIDKSASAEDIKRAYRRLASQHHPDKGGDTAKFQEVEEAYRTLGDPAQRQQYDNPRPNHMHMNFGPGGFDFDEIFSMFGTNFRQQQSQARISLWVTLQDVAQGGPKIIALQVNGKVNNVEIDVPPGINDGDTVRYPKLAPGGHDLVITFRIRPDAAWQREGQHLITEQEVEVQDLILGCDIEVSDILGNKLVLTVPPMTQPGSTLRLRGRGLPSSQMPGRRSHSTAGDLLIRVHTRLPKNIPTDILEALRRWRGH